MEMAIANEPRVKRHPSPSPSISKSVGSISKISVKGVLFSLLFYCYHYHSVFGSQRQSPNLFHRAARGSSKI